MMVDAPRPTRNRPRSATAPAPVIADPIPVRHQLQQTVARAALGVLAGANLVGLWLAALLIWPQLGRAAGPLTYGRWVPVHLDLQLYGWCSLPLVGLLLARFSPDTPRGLQLARIALAAWCGALAAGVVAWLAGHTSGKIFLDWSGLPAIAFLLAQVFLWAVLTAAWWRQVREKRHALSRRVVDGALLLALLAVPGALYFAAQPGVQPPVNPHSGGATGHSLQASTLGIIGLALALPVLLGRPARARLHRATGAVLAMFAGSWFAYGIIPHGNASHHDLAQIAGLATLLPWPIWLVWWFRHFHWEAAQIRWLQSAAAWGTLLVANGFMLFLPGVLERVKFTDSLVAHAHLAMAGLCTSLNLLLLVSLAPRTRLATALAARAPWLAWNLACLAMVILLTGLGWSEGANPWLLFRGAPLIAAGYIARLACGIVMLAAGLVWLRATWPTLPRERPLPHAS